MKSQEQIQTDESCDDDLEKKRLLGKKKKSIEMRNNLSPVLSVITKIVFNDWRSRAPGR